jgi:hypothetical protein
MCNASVEIGLDRLRRHVHGEINLDWMRNIDGRTCCRLGNEGALPDSRIEQAAAARLSVRAGHSRKINPQRLRQRTMGRHLFAALQPPARNIV